MKTFLRFLLPALLICACENPAFAQWTSGTVPSWTQADTLTTEHILSLAVGPNGYLYAGTKYYGLWRSTDNGATWTQRITPPTVYAIWSITIDPSGNIYAGTHFDGVYRSTDQGDNWSQIMSPSYISNTDYFSVAVTSTGTILAANGSSSAPILRSTDNGLTWNQSWGPTYVKALAANSAFYPVTGTCYAGSGYGYTYYSTNDGDSWEWSSGVKLGDGKPFCNFVVTSIANAFAATDDGVFKTGDGGSTWSSRTDGLTTDFSGTGYFINCMVNDNTATTQPFFLLGTCNGVYWSDNSGGSWYTAGLSTMNVLSVTNSSTGCMFVGTDGQGLWYTGDIPLPVEMASFAATTSSKSVQLEWQTKSEIQNAGFNVLRKEDSQTGYTLIAGYESTPSLCGLGTSTTGQKYHFDDSKVDAGKSYDYEIEQVSLQSNKKIFGPLRVEVTLAPKEYSLEQNFPNPFNPTTTIRYGLRQTSSVTLEVYNVLGQRVLHRYKGIMDAGTYNEVLDMSRFAGGVYYYRIAAEGVDGQRFMSVKKFVMVK